MGESNMVALVHPKLNLPHLRLTKLLLISFKSELADAQKSKESEPSQL